MASQASSAADSYIGCLISLTSKSEIRYEGVLYNVNTQESSIGLRNVRSFGTEGRKKDGPQIPPGDKVYEYILFRGTDIKDLQVKSSPPVQPTAPINADPAIIQSQYPRPVTTSTSLPAASGSLTDLSSSNAMQLGHPGPNFQGPLPLYQPGGNIGSWGASSPAPNANGGTSTSLPAASGSLTDLSSSHATQLGHPGPNFQGPLPLYQPGGNIGSWGAPSPAPNVNGGGPAMPMFWQGYYGAPNGLPQLHQQSLLRPPPGLSMPSSMQQPMQFPNFSPSLPTGPSNLPEFPSGYLPVGTSSPSVTSNSILSSNLPSTLPPAPSATLAPETSQVSVSNKAPTASLPAAKPVSNLPSLTPFTNGGPDTSALVHPFNKPNAVSGSSLPYQTASQLTPAIVGSSNSIQTEPPVPSLVTPGQLLQSGPTVVSSSQPSQTLHKDVEVVKVSSTSLAESSVPVSAESQPPILPLPVTSRPSHRPGGASIQTHHGYGYRGRGRGRGAGGSRPVERFTEDFDFMAMNEKFKKDEVWGHLGKSSKSHSKEKDGEENAYDVDDYQDEDSGDVPKLEVKPIYNKDDFFDSISSNALDNDSQHGRIRYSEQIKIDTETFGDFTRHRGGWGGRGPWRGGGGRPRGGFYGRGYGYTGRGRGRGMSSRP